MPFAAYLFDLDGTLYRGDEAISGAAEVVAELRRRGSLIRYLTNNSSLTRDAFVAKLSRLGFETHPHEVYSSATGTAAYLAQHAIKSAFVVGMPGLVTTLSESGIRVINVGADGHVVPMADGTADAVVVGICREFTYDLLRGAMAQVRAGARFIATNPDTTFPLEGGDLVPGAGSLVAAVAACTATDPFVVGKPNPLLVQQVLADAGLSPEQALVVGDRLDTDIACGRAAGCPTFLVMTGVETSAPTEGWSGPTLAPLLAD